MIVYKLLGDGVCGDCGPTCLSDSPFPLLFPRAQEQFVASVALIISSGIRAWGKKRWVEMSIGNCQRWSSVCRASAAIWVKKCTGNTASWVSAFFPALHPSPIFAAPILLRPCKEGRSPASSLRLPLLIFLLHRLLDIWSMNFFSCKIVTAGVSYSPKWQRSLFLEPGVQCWIDVIIAQPPSQLALMGN